MVDTSCQVPVKHLTDKDIFGTDQMSNTEPYRTARVFLFNGEGKLAVLYQEKVNYYSFPGGKIEEGETGSQAACREVLEETGYQCTVDAFVCRIEENRGSIDSVVHSSFYIAHAVSDTGELHLTEREVQAKTRCYGWFTVEETRKLLLQSSTSTPLGKYLQARDLLALDELEAAAHKTAFFYDNYKCGNAHCRNPSIH